MIKELNLAEQAIHRVIERFTEAWNKHDAAAYSLVFAEDADFTNVFGQKFHGRPAIEAQHALIFSTMFKSSHLTCREISVRLIDQNLATVDVIWNMKGATNPQGNPWPDRKGLLSLIMKNVGDKWSILIMHNMELPAISSN